MTNHFKVNYIYHIRMNLTRLAFVSLLISCTISAYTYQKYLVNDPDAKCLDGSTPVYYLK